MTIVANAKDVQPILDIQGISYQEMINRLEQIINDEIASEIADWQSIWQYVDIWPPGGLYSSEDEYEALQKLKNTQPGFYQQWIQNFHIFPRHIGQNDLTSDAAGLSASGSAVNSGYVYINDDSNTAYQQFAGDNADFLAGVILHESLHIYYYWNGETSQSDASRAWDEASARYWVEVWAWNNGIAPISPNSSVNGVPDYPSIYQQVLNDGYSPDAGSDVPKSPPPS